MPNGGNPEECAKSEPFYRGIESTLKSFAEKHALTYIPWYHDVPCFILEWTDPSDGLSRAIEVNLDPVDPSFCIMDIFSDAFSDKPIEGKQGRRIKSFFIMRGELPRDSERLVPFLRLALVTLTATTDQDLLELEKWQEQESELAPLFDLRE